MYQFQLTHQEIKANTMQGWYIKALTIVLVISIIVFSTTLPIILLYNCGQTKNLSCYGSQHYEIMKLISRNDVHYTKLFVFKNENFACNITLSTNFVYYEGYDYEIDKNYAIYINDDRCKLLPERNIKATFIDDLTIVIVSIAAVGIMLSGILLPLSCYCDKLDKKDEKSRKALLPGFSGNDV